MSLRPTKGICKECGTEQWIVNKTHMLCDKHNNIRLHGSPYGKQYQQKIGLSDKAKNQIKLDEEFYEKVFNKSNHKCENCGSQLPTRFRDEDGKIIARWRYAHRWPKSTYPEWRHELWNMFNACLTCHQQYDFGDKESMKVWAESLRLFDEHKNFK